MNTAERLKELRERRGLSQEQLAKIIGVDRTTIVKYETGASRPTRYLKKIAHYFDVTTDYLLGEEELTPKKGGLVMLSNKLKELRAKKDMSQAELAEILGVTQQAVGRWEKDLNMPDLEMLNKIADYFHVTTDELLGRDAPKAIPAKEAPAPPTILMRAEQDLPPEKRKLLEDMAKALLGSDEKIQAALESSPSSPSTRTSTGRASTRTEKQTICP